MKLLAFTDTHEDPRAFTRLRRLIAQERVDLAACVGDFTVMGRSTQKMLHELDTLGVPVVLIHGNHEDEEEVESLLDSCKNITWAHQRLVTVKGIPFVGFGGGGFREREPALERLEKELGDRITPRTIIMCHAPPAGTTTDAISDDWHVGNESLSALIRRRRPLLVLCGHIHECFHAHDTLAGTTIINPGPDGEIIEIDVEDGL